MARSLYERQRLRRCSALLLWFSAQHRAVEAGCAEPWSIATTSLPISGCYSASTYVAVDSTPVYTAGGKEPSSTGTNAVLGHFVDPEAEATWIIGIVVPNENNDGVDVVDTICLGSAEYSTTTPPDISSWTCDADGDGRYTEEERGDFDRVTCDCPDNLVTSTPTPISPVTQGPRTPPPTQFLGLTPAPTGTPLQESPAENTPNRTPSPTVSGGTTPGDAETTATAAPVAESSICNITIVSDTLPDVSGCYVLSQSTVGGKPIWEHLDGSGRIQWQKSNGSEYWAIEYTASEPAELVCKASDAAEDPTTIPRDDWLCDDKFLLSERGGFEGLECSETCDVDSNLEANGETSSGASNSLSDPSSWSTAVVGAIAGVGVFIALACCVFMGAAYRRRKRRKAAKTAFVVTSDPNGDNKNGKSAEIPFFDPWGSRPPPKVPG